MGAASTAVFLKVSVPLVAQFVVSAPHSYGSPSSRGSGLLSRHRHLKAPPHRQPRHLGSRVSRRRQISAMYQRGGERRRRGVCDFEVDLDAGEEAGISHRRSPLHPYRFVHRKPAKSSSPDGGNRRKSDVWRTESTTDDPSTERYY